MRASRSVTVLLQNRATNMAMDSTTVGKLRSVRVTLHLHFSLRGVPGLETRAWFEANAEEELFYVTTDRSSPTDLPLLVELQRKDP